MLNDHLQSAPDLIHEPEVVQQLGGERVAVTRNPSQPSNNTPSRMLAKATMDLARLSLSAASDLNSKEELSPFPMSSLGSLEHMGECSASGVGR